METMKDFTVLGSKIIADGDCSHEIKRLLLLGKNAMINLDSILKSRDITLLMKACLVNSMVFLVVMYGCESWTIEKAEHHRYTRVPHPEPPSHLPPHTIPLGLLFNTLSRLVMAFLTRRKRLLISWLLSPSAVILEPKK